MKKLPFILMMMFCVVLVGCSEKIDKYTVINPYSSDSEITKLREELQHEKYVERAIAIFAGEQLLVSVQLNPWRKWQRESIESKLQKKYEKQYSQYDVLVSTDYKIYFESSKLVDEQGGKLNKEVKQLKELAREET